MHLEGQFSVKAARDEVYAFLTDPYSVSRHMPDVKDVQVEDGDHFTVKARVGVRRRPTKGSSRTQREDRM